jgi:hypothetical protein
MSVKVTVVVVALAVLGSAGAEEAVPVPAAQSQARQLAARFQAELLAQLTLAMAQGPAVAVAACTDKAPAIASQLSRESGWQVKRVSLRVRNPLTGVADAWEQARLLEFQARMDAGADPATLEAFATVDEPAGRSERYIKAIRLAPMCEACHGDPTRQSPELRQALADAYPHDAAVGYQAGQLRGAFSFRRRLP